MNLLIVLAAIFERKIVRKKEIIPENIITARIISKLLKERFSRILLTATAVPVLVTFKENIATKPKPATIVLIEPSKIKNCLLFVSPVTSEPMTAACEEPKAGRKEHRGADNIEEKLARKISFLLVLFLSSLLFFVQEVLFSSLCLLLMRMLRINQLITGEESLL